VLLAGILGLKSSRGENQSSIFLGVPAPDPRFLASLGALSLVGLAWRFSFSSKGSERLAKGQEPKKKKLSRNAKHKQHYWLLYP
jgi:hypothetical protein